MDAVPASQILVAAAAIAGEVTSPSGAVTPDGNAFARFTACLSQRLPAIWQATDWPDTRVTEEWRMYDGRLWTTDYRTQRAAKLIDPASGGLYVALFTQTPGAGDNGYPSIPLSDPAAWLQIRACWSDVGDWVATTHYTYGQVVRYSWFSANAGQYRSAIYVCTASALPLGVTPPPLPEPGVPQIFNSYWLQVDSIPLIYQRPARAAEILGVSSTDPQCALTPVCWTEDSAGVRVADERARHWFTYRLRCPPLFGSPLDEEASYSAGSQVYFARPDGQGDFYTVTDTVAPGDTPLSAPAKFSLIEIPARFRTVLTSKITADWLKWRGNDEAARRHEAAGERELDRILIKLEQDERQKQPFRMRR